MIDHEGGNLYTYHENGSLDTFYKPTGVPCLYGSCRDTAVARNDNGLTVYHQRHTSAQQFPIDYTIIGRQRAGTLNLGSIGTIPYDINNSGTVVGGDHGRSNEFYTDNAAIFYPNDITRNLNQVLPTQNFPGVLTSGRRINKNDHIFGFYALPDSAGNVSDGGSRAFFWNGQNIIALPTLPQFDFTGYSYYSLNDSDQIVGTTYGLNSDGSSLVDPFIWDEENGKRPLGSLVEPNSNIAFRAAYDISNSGNIIALGTDSENREKLFLLRKKLERVIFVPGTMGSQMVGNYAGQTVSYWPNINPITVGLPSVYNLTLDQNSQYYKEGLYASDVLTSVARLVPIYQPLLDFLKSKGYKNVYDVSRGYPDKSECDITQKKDDPALNPNLFIFPYDFRKDNAISAQKLNSYVQCVQRFYPPGTKVNIIAHSQGGLVTRRYILQKQAQNQPHGLGKVITIASPWLGAPEALYKIYTGGNREFPFSYAAISPTAIKFLAPHLTSIHQLFPSRTYHQWQGGVISEDGDVNGNGIPNENYSFQDIVGQLNNDFPQTYPGTNGAGFHDFAGQDDWRQDQSAIKYYHIVAEQHELNTTIGLAVKNSWLCRYTTIGSESGRCYENRLYIPAKGFGDGTVPTISASRFDETNNVYLGTTTSEWFLRRSPSEGFDKETEHNGITQSEGTHALIAYLLGVGPKPELEGSPSFAKSSMANTKKTDLSNSRSSDLMSAPVFQRYTSSYFPAPHDLSNYAPARYLTIIGRTDVTVRDENGNTTAIDENGLLRNNVPGLSRYEVIGENSIMLTLSTEHSYSIDFSATETPMEVEMVEGLGNRRPDSALRYKDLNLPTDVNVRMSVPQSGAADLKYDADGDGEFETLVAPTVNLSGVFARDITAPTVTVNVVQQGSTATATIAAQDIGSGIKKTWYSLDGQNFQQYISPVTLQYSSSQVRVTAFADDNAANRSSLVVKTFNFTTTQPTLAVKPVLECVVANTDGTFTAKFGYQNDNSIPVTVAAGTNNRFTPQPENRGQTKGFQPGRQRFTFQIPFDGNNLVWTLKSPNCSRLTMQ